MVIVGMIHEMSPMSSEPPLSGFSSGGLRPFSLTSRPSCLVEPTFFCTAFANACSSSVHLGRPTSSMFFCAASAIGLLKWRGAAVPTMA